MQVRGGRGEAAVLGPCTSRVLSQGGSDIVSACLHVHNINSGWPLGVLGDVLTAASLQC